MLRRSHFENPLKRLEEEQEEPEQEKQLEARLEEIKNFLGEIAGELRKEGIPVNDDCRIDMEAFKEVYSAETLEKDKEIVRGWQKLDKRKFKDLPEEQVEIKRLKKEGEQLEILKTVVLYKFLSEKFIVARTSVFDDIENKVDNLILEKETGNLVCALDEISNVSSVEFERKQAKVLERNREEGGGKLKYGFKKEKDKFVMEEAEHLPIFYFALPSKYIKEGINNLIPELGQSSDYEEKLFSYFIALIKSQISSLHLEPSLDADFRERLDEFGKSIQNIS